MKESKIREFEKNRKKYRNARRKILEDTGVIEARKKKKKTGELLEKTDTELFELKRRIFKILCLSTKGDKTSFGNKIMLRDNDMIRIVAGTNHPIRLIDILKNDDELEPFQSIKNEIHDKAISQETAEKVIDLIEMIEKHKNEIITVSNSFSTPQKENRRLIFKEMLAEKERFAYRAEGDYVNVFFCPYFSTTDERPSSIFIADNQVKPPNKINSQELIEQTDLHTIKESRPPYEKETEEIENIFPYTDTIIEAIEKANKDIERHIENIHEINEFIETQFNKERVSRDI